MLINCTTDNIFYVFMFFYFLYLEFFDLLFILCSEIPIVSKECFNKDSKFCKSSKSLLKSLMSWYLGVC